MPDTKPINSITQEEIDSQPSTNITTNPTSSTTTAISSDISDLNTLLSELKFERSPLDADAWFLDEDRRSTDIDYSYKYDIIIENMSIENRIIYFREICKNLLMYHKAEDMIPSSGKIVVFDCDLPVKHAFFGLLEHDIKCAPIWDSKKLDFVGMLTVSDFIDVLRYFYSLDKCKSVPLMLVDQVIRDWAEIKANLQSSIPHLLYVDPDVNLLEALQILQKHRIHRLPVLQTVPEQSILCLLTHQRILNFLLLKFKAVDKLNILHKITIAELNIGVLKPEMLQTITYDTPLITALDKLSEFGLSGLPVVDENGVLIDIYSRSDVLYLAIDKTYSNLDMTVKQALVNHTKFRNVPYAFLDDSLFTVFSRLVQNRKLRMIVVEPDTKKVIGTVALSDVFKFILDSSTRSEAPQLTERKPSHVSNNSSIDFSQLKPEKIDEEKNEDIIP